MDPLLTKFESAYGNSGLQPTDTPTHLSMGPQKSGSWFLKNTPNAPVVSLIQSVA